MSRTEAEIGLEHGLAGNIMWGADYPHPEGSFPNSVLSLRQTMAGLPTEILTAYLSGTASKAYTLNIEALKVVAEKVCPTIGEVMEPFTSRPEGSATSFAFRKFGHWA